MALYGKDASIGGFLTYINGVRVPSTSASVSVQSGKFASASITVPPHSLLNSLGDEDNLSLAIFYLDTYYYDDPTWCLLFEGSIVGQTYSNEPDGEMMSFSADSNANMLGKLYFSFLKKKKGANTATKDYPNQIVVRGKTASSFLSESLSGRPLARPFDFLENVFNICLGVKRDTDRSDLRQSAQSVESLIESKKAQLQRSYQRRIERAARRNPGGLTSDLTRSQREQALLRGIHRDTVSLAVAQGGSMDSIEKFQDLLVRAEIANDLQEKAIQGSKVAITGFFARFMRLIRFREHWVCSPYLEGIPNSPDPIKGHMGGGVFPLLRSVKAKKFVKAMVKQTGAQYGVGGSALGLLTNLYSMYFYSMTEVLAPPAYQVDKYGLPYSGFYDGASIGNDGVDYVEWGATLHAAKRRLAIASYITHPMSSYSIPPACNVIFPSMTFRVQVQDSYSSKPTRVYYNKKTPRGKLNLKNSAPGYNMDPTRVGYPSVAAGHAQTAAGGSREGLEYLIFPEEYFRGPTPTISNMHPTYLDLQKYANSARFSAPKNLGAPVSMPAGLDPETANRALSSAQSLSRKGYSSYALYFLVAQKEYLSAKYGAVSGSVSGIFNPYAVVGMPCALLTNGDSGQQVYGEIVAISHTLTAQSSTTSYSIAKIRPVEDVIKNIMSDAAGLDMSPQEPISEVRDLLQVFETANEYYTQLFKKNEIGAVKLDTQEARENLLEAQKYLEEHNDLVERLRVLRAQETPDEELIASYESDSEAILGLLEPLLASLESVNAGEAVDGLINLKMPSAFNFKQFLGWKGSGVDGDPHFVVLRDTDIDSNSETPERYESTGYQEDKRLVPLPEAKKYFNSTNQAMRYCSRPVCTLEQYIDFYATAGRTAANLDPIGRGRGVRLNPKVDPHSGAVYYDVIRQYIGGPGLEPGSSVRGKSRATLAELERLSRSIDELSDESLYSAMDRLREAETEGVLQLTTITEQGPNQVFKTFSQDDVAKYTDLADSRKDWQSLLLDYLTIIEGRNPTRGV